MAVESNNGAKARNERLYYGCGPNESRKGWSEFSRFSVIATYTPSAPYLTHFLPLIVVVDVEIPSECLDGEKAEKERWNGKAQQRRLYQSPH